MRGSCRSCVVAVPSIHLSCHFTPHLSQMNTRRWATAAGSFGTETAVSVCKLVLGWGECRSGYHSWWGQARVVSCGLWGQSRFFCPYCLCFLSFKSEVFVAECMWMLLGYEECKTTMTWFFSGTGCWQLLVTVVKSWLPASDENEISVSSASNMLCDQGCEEERQPAEEREHERDLSTLLPPRPWAPPKVTSAAHEPLLLHCKERRHPVKYSEKSLQLFLCFPALQWKFYSLEL